MISQNLNKRQIKGSPAKLYEIVIDRLREGILSRQYKPGEELPSERELCNILGVSRITVRRALSELARAGWTRSISGKANIVSETAGSIIPPVCILLKQKTFDISMSTGNPACLERLAGAIGECRKRGIPFNIAPIAGDVDYDQLLKERQSLLILEWDLYKEMKSFLEDNPDYPVVTCMMSINQDWINGSPTLPSVINDDAPGVTAAVEWLVSHGRKNIVFLSKQNLNFNLASRRNAYVRTMEEYGLRPRVLIADPSNELIKNLDNQMAVQVNSGRSIIRDLLNSESHPEGIVATNDAYAFGAYDELRMRGVKVHDDCTIIGFDDSNLSQISDQPLYSIKKPRYKSGAEAVSLLVKSFGDSIRKPCKVILNSEFINNRKGANVKK